MKRPSLLYVEHDAQDLELVTTPLEAAGYSVQIASTTGTALGLFQSAAFDAVVLEHQPPMLDAAALLSRLRGWRADIPAVLFAADAHVYTEDAEKRSAVCPKRLGADGLLEALRRLLDSPRKQRQAMRQLLQEGRDLRREQHRLVDEQRQLTEKLLASAQRAGELTKCRRILSVCYLPGLFGLRRRALQVGGYEVVAAMSRLVAEGLLYHQSFDVIIIGQAVPLDDKYLLVTIASERNIPSIVLYRNKPDTIPRATAQLRGPEDPCAILSMVESLLREHV